jgi:hypothetical protein
MVSATAGAVNDVVTLSLRQYVNANKVRVLVWYGQVTGSGGEQVEVQARDCGTKAFYRIAETAPGPGGAYEIESESSVPPYGRVLWKTAQTYRARWGDQLSAPVPGPRFPLRPWAEKVRGKRAWKVHVNDSEVTGKPVLLQRKRGRSWTAYTTAKLRRKPYLTHGAYNHEAVFEVPARGLTLRAFVPAKTAGACHLPGASEPWRS